MAISTRTYHDFTFTFSANPMSGDVSKSIGATAVKRAMVAIMKTNNNERMPIDEAVIALRKKASGTFSNQGVISSCRCVLLMVFQFPYWVLIQY